MDLQNVIETLDILSQIDTRTYFILNTKTYQFVYRSTSPLLFCHSTEQQTANYGISEYMTNICPEHLQYLQKSIQCIRNDYTLHKKIQDDSHIHFHFSHTIYINKKAVSISQSLIPLRINDNTLAGLFIGTVSPMYNLRQQIAFLCHAGNNNKTIYYYNKTTDNWSMSKEVELSNNMLNMVQLANLGLSIKQIAEKMNKSEDTIKFYRRKLFDIFQVDNIHDALLLLRDYSSLLHKSNLYL